MCTVLLPPGVNPFAVKYIIHLININIVYSSDNINNALSETQMLLIPCDIPKCVIWFRRIIYTNRIPIKGEHKGNMKYQFKLSSSRSKQISSQLRFSQNGLSHICQCDTHKCHHQPVAQYFYIYYTQLLHVSTTYPGHRQEVTRLGEVYSVFGNLFTSTKLVTSWRWPEYVAKTCSSCV
jgi:hypothetical protein